MDQPSEPLSPSRPVHLDADDDLPPGDHALEVAARSGIGPLSPLGREVWHGRAIPCVSCGQLVRRDEAACDHCGQDLGEEMIRKMRAHAGPWYVLEHVRPFPGVTLERIVRQIRRGLLTETSIVRGPATDFQWRFAVETSGLCRYFGKCWKCHAQVSAADAGCPTCQASLNYAEDRPERCAATSDAPAKHRTPEPRAAPLYAKRQGSARANPAHVQPRDLRRPTAELEALSAAVGAAERQAPSQAEEEPPRIGPIPASLIAVIMLFVIVAVLTFISQCRSREHGQASRTPPPTTMVAPPSSVEDR